MDTKKIVAMLLVVTLFFSMAQQVVFGVEEETYTLPVIRNVNKTPGKMEYALINDLFVAGLFQEGEGVELMDNPQLLAKAKEITASSNLEYLDNYANYVLKTWPESDGFISFRAFGSRGLERNDDFQHFEHFSVPKPGDIAWEGMRPWSQGFIVDSIQGDKVEVYGYEKNSGYTVLRANIDRFYYFRPMVSEVSTHGSPLTRDNFCLMLRRSRRPLMVGHNGYFYPDRLVTRAEFAQILVNLFELDTPKVETTSFYDIKPTDWFAPAVEAAKKAGLINGTPEGKFLPKGYVTYEHVAVVFANYWKQTGLYQKRHNPAIYLKDVGGEVLHARLQKSYAREEIEFSVTLGVFPGYSKDALYNYSDAVSRMEMAEMLYKIAGRHDLGENSKYYKKENRPKFKDVDPQRSIPSRLAVPVLD